MKIFLGARGPGIPFQAIIQAWVNARFEPRACRTIVEQLIESTPALASYLIPEALTGGGSILTPAALYPAGTIDLLAFLQYGASTKRRQLTGLHQLELEPEQLGVACDLLRGALRSSNPSALRAQHEHLGAKFLNDVFPAPIEVTQHAPTWPGIYRREHASLLICSETTRLLLDPLAPFVDLPALDRCAPRWQREDIDAIVITHSHGDHWHLPSILAHAPSDQTPVIVPHVPRVNLLTPVDMPSILAQIGQATLCPRWGSTIQVGDIEIDVLPFYGEQPTRAAPGPATDLRSWGNCYRFNLPQFSAMVLVDSGDDPLGTMDEVIEASSRRRGPPDVVLSCLRSFPCPFFGGLASYWGALPFERLRELYRQHEAGVLPFTTAGTDGTAALCAIAGARHYLPYANGFAGVGAPIADIGWGEGEPSERACLMKVERALADAGATTRVVPWLPGDSARFSGGALTIQ